MSMTTPPPNPSSTDDDVTTDSDGTDNSDILHIPYPPSDPQQWVRNPEPGDAA